MTGTMTPSRDIARLIEIMTALRTPVTGCPWDLEQNFATIAPHTLEEAYEVADAIARDDLVDLQEELGDLLLQVVYHARMAEEQQAFDFGDVVHGITKKMIRRHPHVFGDETARTAGDVSGLWDRIKAEEKAEKAAAHARAARERPSAARQHAPSLLDDVAVALPALTRAIKLQHKAARVGFDWPNIAPVFAKLKEEIGEFEEVARALDPRGSAPSPRPPHNEAAVKEEFGDMLFVMANIARHLHIDAEDALRGANAKFVRRFQHIEQSLAAEGRSPAQSSLQEMDALWDQAKAAEKSGASP